MYDDLRGLYKISEKLLYKLVRPRNCSKDGSFGGASRYEMLSVLYFTQIADKKGYIDAFRISDLCSVTGCSRREAYLVLTSMEDKGFISMGKSDFYGRYNITLADSDFSSFDKRMRYLNTNHELFCGNGFPRFKQLSTTAMKLFLYLSFKYDDRFGYHVSFFQLTCDLGLKHKAPVIRALKELSCLIDVDDILYSIRNDEKRRLRFGFLDLPKSLIIMRKNEGIADGQPAWYKRRLEGMIKQTGFPVSSVRECGYLLNELFHIASHHLKSGKSLEFIENTFMSVIETDGCLNDRTVYTISEKLLAA